MAMPARTYDSLLITGAGRKTAVNRGTTVRERTAQGFVSPRFSSSLERSTAQSEFYTPWGSNFLPSAIRQDFLGFTTTVKSGGNILGLNRTIPYPMPTDPNYLYADAVQSIEGDIPQGRDGINVAKYDEAKLTITYSTRPYIIGDSGVNDESTLQTYVSIHADMSARYERVPGASTLKWNSVPPVPATNLASVILFSEGEVTVNWYQVPVDGIPWSNISNCIGKFDAINNGNNTFDFLSNTYIGPVFQVAPAAAPAGRTIPVFFCLVPKFSDPYPMTTGDYAVDIQYRFKFFPNGVPPNFAYRWDRGTFQETVLGNTGQGVIKGARLQTLFWGS